MAPNEAVMAFARMLAAEKDPAARASLVKRAQMLAMNEAQPEAFEPPVRTLGEYLATPIDIPPSLVWPTIVVRGEVTTTLGRAGKGKTTMNLNRLLKWGAGRPMFDAYTDEDGRAYLAPDEPLRCMIVENEGSAGMFHHKMGLMLEKCGDVLSNEDRDLIRENIYVWGDGGYSGLRLDEPAKLAELRAGVEKVKPDIVFIEPFRSLWRGEENSATDMNAVVDNLVGLATDYGCGVILSHHERKGGAGDDGELMSAGRGSTVLEGVVAVMENFQSAKGGDYRELTWSKSRYLVPPPPMRLEYDRETGWYRYVAMDHIEASIIQAITDNGGDALNISGLAEATDEKEHKLRKIVAQMCDEGRLKKLPNASNGAGSTGFRYRLPSGDNIDNGGGLSSLI